MQEEKKNKQKNKKQTNKTKMGRRFLLILKIKELFFLLEF
jgi:hypothetical protein